MTHICTHCDAYLAVGENWYDSAAKRNCFICMDCWKHWRVISNPKHNPQRMFVNGKYVPKSHPLHKAGNYKSFGDAAFASLQKDKPIKEGHVYAIQNAAWPEWIKIGKAIDAEDRLNGYQTSSPMRDYTLLYYRYFDDRNTAEKKAHILAATQTTHPWNKHDNGEWFKLTQQQAIDIIKEIE